MALVDNILAQYKFDNGSYTTDSVNSYTLNAKTSTQQSSGFIGYCGSGQALSYSGNYGLTGTSDFSISMWIKFTSEISSGGCGLLFIGSKLTTDRFLSMDYEYNSGTRRLNFYNSSNSSSATYNVALGTSWHHLVISRSSGSANVYLDNSLVMSGVSQGVANGIQNTLTIGYGKSYPGIATYYYDEIIPFARALSSGDVSELYNSGAGLQYPFTTANTTNFFQFF